MREKRMESKRREEKQLAQQQTQKKNEVPSKQCKRTKRDDSIETNFAGLPLISCSRSKSATAFFPIILTKLLSHGNGVDLTEKFQFQ